MSAQGSSGLSFQRSSLGVGGAAAAGPRLAEPSFVGMPFRGVGTSSGTFIRQVTAVSAQRAQVGRHR